MRIRKKISMVPDFMVVLACFTGMCVVIAVTCFMAYAAGWSNAYQPAYNLGYKDGLSGAAYAQKYEPYINPSPKPLNTKPTTPIKPIGIPCKLVAPHCYLRGY